MKSKFYLNLNWISKWTSSPISAQNPSKQFSSFSKITEKSLSESRTKILVEVVRVEIEAMFSEKSTKIFFQPGSRKVYEFSRVFSRVSSRFSKSHTTEYSEDSYKRLKIMYCFGLSTVLNNEILTQECQRVNSIKKPFS